MIIRMIMMMMTKTVFMMMDRGVKSSLEQSLTIVLFLRSVLSLPSTFKDKNFVQAWNSQIMVVYPFLLSVAKTTLH